MVAILGIETSCDETAVAVLDGRSVLSHEVLSQKEHSSFGGVVPEIAARAHSDFLHVLVSKAMGSAGLEFSDLSAIAVTSGPGLVGSLIVGVMLAKAIAYVTRKPIIAVNHLEAHALVARMIYTDLEFPFLILIISGGHCQFLIAHDVGRYTKLGESVDDSLGETFDKVARMLGLGYPGGPEVENCALKGDAHRFPFPRALKSKPGCNFSFSGLKTAVRYAIAREGRLDNQAVYDVCASFQQCVSEILVSRIANAMAAAKASDSSISKIVVSGGVAANNFLRGSIHKCANTLGFDAVFPPQELCTDNGIMVGWAGLENLRSGNFSSLGLIPRARWPLGCL
ncbi:tRNA (adenosine(37)-N6)-threonylcarbamoyltransferase complex transferase subunit TsaD [Anaplasma ovis str. Haibei]|uniref:tRNA N6-adenosine threonylcarbamoyltransferase n=1 Tax=Anaplasma ovis str. Haibei TaxID=1248439 RepID=A0A2Z2LI69_9RICK|nr:tRNA (adenosine(37)-N6)-threonylcarbamoyltransferase complex transferase subunit TsaD [Anaplasma ovis]ASI47641.1 tRNA (adenosine(37)-N6)-threonylcarbamoyltransferase complex transferase subunit TsaD [Anaplasma ovis str. Haibei]